MTKGDPNCDGLVGPFFVIDLDGTLVRGRSVAAGADKLLQQMRGRLVVVSNNSSHSVSDLAEELASAGLELPPEKLILAGVVAVQVVARDHDGARVFLMGSASLVREAERAGLNLVEDGADVVLLARDEGFTYDKLSRAVNEIRRGASLVVSNPDLSHPGASDLLVPETGALLQAVIACVGAVPMRIIGKPEPHLFHEAMRRLGSSLQNSVVIGDNPETDIAGASRLGLPYLLLGAGPHADAENLTELVERLAQDRQTLSAFPRLAASNAGVAVRIGRHVV